MKIRNQHHSTDPVEYVNINGISRGKEGTMQRKAVLAEHRMEIFIDGCFQLRVSCIDQYLEELVLGRLFTEGKISGCSEVRRMEISLDGARAEVFLQKEGESAKMKQTAKGDLKGRKRVPRIEWKPEQIFCLADRLAEGMPLHQESFSAHSAFLMQEGKIIFTCEDLGRHHAIDKAVGYALSKGIDLGTCILYSSGRISLDMAEKAVNAGIPVFAAKGSPTEAAVRFAKERNLVLIGNARSDRMNLYTKDI